MSKNGSLLKRVCLWALPMVALHAQTIKTGPEVGQLVPALSATDQNGRTMDLKSIMGPKGAMLVFFRSADWCPFCKIQLVELQQSLELIQKQGLGIAAISYDSVACSGVLRIGNTSRIRCFQILIPGSFALSAF